MFTWRALMPSLLEWMTPQLAGNDLALTQRAAQQARRAAAAKHAPKPKKTAVSTASHKG